MIIKKMAKMVQEPAGSDLEWQICDILSIKNNIDYDILNKRCASIAILKVGGGEKGKALL